MLFVSQLCEILQNEMRKRFFLRPLSINNQMNSEAQTNNKPIKLNSRKSKELMVSYPEHYYKEIVEYLRNSNSYYQ